MQRLTKAVSLAVATAAAVFGPASSAPAQFDSWQSSWWQSYWWFAYSLPPNIQASVDQPVIFENETAQIRWNITNADCATFSDTHRRSFLVPDPDSLSGTRPAGGSVGGGGYLSCGLPMSGTMHISGARGHGLVSGRFYATNAAGRSAVRYLSLDILSQPNFTGDGNTSSRRVQIRNAIKQFTKRLRDGCIYYDTELDTTVAAFRFNQLSRTTIWSDLLTELHNLNLTTFDCRNENGAPGSWSDRSRNIVLRWNTSAPNLPYVILHEHIHKVGFNSQLFRLGYSGDSIESQTHTVTQACF